ncbi:glycosyltransferase family 2 protein, partial [Vibrio lentus]
MNNFKKLIKIIIRKYQSIVNKSNVIKEPTLIMTILAKDEVDVIEQQLIFHKRMGVDSFVVTDNGSSDGTLEVFEKYQKKGWIKEIILEPSKDYYQTEWVDNMI